jgi:hypothetical protein
MKTFPPIATELEAQELTSQEIRSWTPELIGVAIEENASGALAIPPNTALGNFTGETAVPLANDKNEWLSWLDVPTNFAFGMLSATVLDQSSEIANLETNKVDTTDPRLSDARTPLSHTHGNITNAGAIGSTANRPLITTTGGVITVGNFGTTANTFCQGNDSRLSDARAPLSHTHGNISNTGAIGSTANLPLITTTSGVITVGSFGTDANTFCQGNDSRLSDARTPLAHNQAWSTITSTPTTLSGYGITDAQASDSDLNAIAALAANGIIVRSGTGTAAVRTITGTANQITVTNGDGVGGNPVLSLPQNIHSGATPGFAGIQLNAGNVIRSNGGWVEARNSANNDHGPFSAQTIAVANAGLGSVAAPLDIDLDFRFNTRTRLAGKIRGRGRAINLNPADIIICANPNNSTVDGSNLVDDITIFGSSGNVGLGRGLFFTRAYTVATLPAAAANAGAEAQVTDSSVTTHGSTVAGGGANRVKVFSNGTNWLVN